MVSSRAVQNSNLGIVTAHSTLKY